MYSNDEVTVEDNKIVIAIFILPEGYQLERFNTIMIEEVSSVKTNRYFLLVDRTSLMVTDVIVIPSSKFVLSSPSSFLSTLECPEEEVISPFVVQLLKR